MLSQYPMMPAVAFIILPTLFLRGIFLPIPSEAAPWYHEHMAGDIRSYWKSVLLCGTSLWMGITFGAALLGGKPLREKVLPALLAAAAIATVMSVLLSPYPQTSWIGFTLHYEGAFALFAYLLALWYFSEMITVPGGAVWLLRTLGLVATINAVIGATAGFGHNLWETDLGHWLMGVSDVPVTHYFAGSRMAAGTVFQPNHYGMLMATLGSVALAMTFYETRWWRVAWGAVLTGSVLALVFSQSRAAVLVFLAVSMVYLGNRFIRKRNWRRPKITVVIPVAAIVILLLALPSVRSAIANLAKRTVTLSFAYKKDYLVKALGLKDNIVRLRLENATFILARRDASSWFFGREGEAALRIVAAEGERGGWSTARLPEVESELSWRPQGNVRLHGPDLDVYFFSTINQLYVADTNQRLYPELAMSAYQPNGWEGLFSGRGYIWTRTLEIFRRNPWFGTGPGTFAMAYPNDDLLNKYRFSQNLDEDKGHGIWASFLVQLGLIGVILYTLPVVYIAFACWRRGGALAPVFLAGMAAFVLSSLTNDSTVGVTPVFCVLAGLAMAYARTVKETDSGD